MHTKQGYTMAEEYEQKFLEIQFVLALVLYQNYKCKRFKDVHRDAIKILNTVTGHRRFCILVKFTTEVERHLNKQCFRRLKGPHFRSFGRNERPPKGGSANHDLA